MNNQLINEIAKSLNEQRKVNVAKWDCSSDIKEEFSSISLESDISTVTEDIEFSKTSGREITSVEDYEAYSLWEVYYELHKDVHGVKARFTKWFDHDKAGWKDAILKLQSRM